MDINEEFLEWMESGSLAVEVWGHHKGGETPPEDEKRSKTFTERSVNHKITTFCCHSDKFNLKGGMTLPNDSFCGWRLWN